MFSSLLDGVHDVRSFCAGLNFLGLKKRVAKCGAIVPSYSFKTGFCKQLLRFEPSGMNALGVSPFEGASGLQGRVC